MIAVSYYCKRVWNKASLYALLLLFITALTNQSVQAQDRVEKRAALEQAIQKTTLSETALSRMTATIAAKRAEKSSAGNGFKQAPAVKQLIASVKNSLSASAADVAYGSNYFDTISGDDFSFPEDTHDYCRASFNSDTAIQDYYLNANLDPGESLVATLTWNTQADYDLYIFDVEGYPVGDLDPEADFNGSNGIDLQGTGSVLEENASIVHDRGAAGNEFVVVVDRFRGAADNELVVNLSGNDGVFAVMEYVAADNLSYLNTAANTTVGPLTDGITIDAATAENFSAQFNTDGCAQSVVFTLVDENGNPVLDDMGDPAITDNAPPFSAYGDDVNTFNGVTLLPGTYTLTATPYSQVDGADGVGVPGAPQEATFTVIQDEDDPASIVSFTLVDTDNNNAPVSPEFDPIQPGATIDLVGLPLNLALRANPEDPDVIIEAVDINLAITKTSGTVVPANQTGNAAPYLLDWLNDGKYASPATFPVGEYAVTGTPSGSADASRYISGAVAFTVIGPRIISYSLINGVDDVPVAGFDPLEENATISLAALAASFRDSLNIRANTRDFGQNNDTGETIPDNGRERAIDLVKFELTIDGNPSTGNGLSQQESVRPYAVYGDPADDDLDPPDEIPDYEAKTLSAGDYALTGRSFYVNTDEGELGGLVLNFEISNSAAERLDEISAAPALMANYPNPFNPVTTIQFSLPASTEIRLTVHDMLGRTVKILVDGTLGEGFHEAAFEAGSLSSGMYMYRLETPTGVQVRPMTLLK